MYSQSHFYSTAHEVFGVASGKARLCFGGEENPERVEAVLEKGDVMIVPAGVAHRFKISMEASVWLGIRAGTCAMEGKGR